MKDIALLYRLSDIKINTRSFVIRIIFVALFGYSFIQKVISHEDFVNFIYSIIGLNKYFSIYISDVSLGIELYLTIQFLLTKNLSSLLKQAAIVLIGFSLILIYLLLFKKVDNCYCFGTAMSLTPAQSLLKNGVILIVTFICSKFISDKEKRIILKEDIVKLFFSIILILFAFNTPHNLYGMNYNVLSVNQLKEMMSEEKVMIIDARTYNVYERGHIPSAINYPLEEQDGGDIQIPNTDAFSYLVVYCDSEMCSLSKRLASELMKKYHNKKIYILLGGFEEWQKNG